MINQYLPVLSGLSDLQFVTLTAPTVDRFAIGDRVVEMGKKWRKIADMARKCRAGFAGIRKTELKVARRGLYHCHYHIILSGADNALWLVKQWLRLNPTASELAQDVRCVNDVAPALIELMKYTTKLTCAENGSNEVLAHPDQLDVIFRALFKKRLYQSFGGIRAIDEDAMDITPEVVKKAAGLYQWIGHDWIHARFGQLLSNWVPEKEDLDVVSMWDKSARVP